VVEAEARAVAAEEEDKTARVEVEAWAVDRRSAPVVSVCARTAVTGRLMNAASRASN
jgi:hypothetical protein